MFIVGILLIIFSILSVVICVSRTPDNLRGFYGAMYIFIALGAFIGGILLLL